jgi:hypothetical protein
MRRSNPAAGYYKMGDAYIHISAVMNGLVLEQMWDNQKISFSPQTGLEFMNDGGKVCDAK